LGRQNLQLPAHFSWSEMSFYNVAKRLTGKIANTSLLNAQDAVLKALGEIYDQSDWSFQKAVSGWLCPGMVANVGTTTTTPYSDQVICDATATARLAAWTGMPLITQLQYRDPNYLPYDIIGYDTTTNAPFATLTLNRPWMEPTSGPGQPYFIYQVYFVAPVKDFRKFVAIEDPTDNGQLNFWTMTQADLAVLDAQRTNFSDSAYVVPAGMDLRTGSATYGWQRFELWPHQTNYVPYTFTYRSRGPIPENPSDFLTLTTPYPITEDQVEWKAREILCEDAEANRDRMAPKGAGANWIVLSQMAAKQYERLRLQALDIDLNLDGESQTHTKMKPLMNGQPYATQGGGLNLGRY
jgi:hypothetical protein